MSRALNMWLLKALTLFVEENKLFGEEEGCLSSGWVKLHRKILDHEIWNDLTTFRLFTLLLLKANHQEKKKINGLELKQGQYIRSYSKLSEDLAYKEGRGMKSPSKATIMRSAKKLQSNGIVTISETVNGTMFTIVNYQLYQDFDGNREAFRETVTKPFVNRIQNEDETKSEPYQELKNLRIKEKERQPSSEQDLTPFQKIEDKYLSRKGGMFTTPYDVAAINRILDQQIPIEDVLAWIDEIFDRYVPKHRADGIKSFTYCEQGILDRWHAKQSPPPKTNVSEFRPRGSKQEESFAALEAYAKENGISMG